MKMWFRRAQTPSTVFSDRILTTPIHRKWRRSQQLRFGDLAQAICPATFRLAGRENHRSWGVAEYVNQVPTPLPIPHAGSSYSSKQLPPQDRNDWINRRETRPRGVLDVEAYRSKVLLAAGDRSLSEPTVGHVTAQRLKATPLFILRI